jgi:two-component system chemotaxis sensor kinase CheA
MAVDIDLSQFREIFYEESIERLETMESGLLDLDIGTPDPEVINTIFRDAHSIKGGAGTFGFGEISDFTHVVEALLNEVRDQKRTVTKELVDIMLESVDCIRYMISQSKADQPVDETRVTSLKERLISLPKEDKEAVGWRIQFKPFENLLKNGNDPYRILRELETMGSMQVTANIERLPAYSDLDPECCYIDWDILVQGNASREQISELFEWVEGDCKLEITLEGDRRHSPERRSETGRTSGRRITDTENSITSQDVTSIRVNINKVDNLVNLVGELVITQSMLGRFTTDFDLSEREKLKESIEQLERNTRELQEQTMRIRMLPIDSVYQRLPRLVRDLSQTFDKQAELKLSGNTTEVDKTVIEKISDPLVHLIRNALAHGIEMPAARGAQGKPLIGTIEINAYHEGGNIFIKVMDDGAGLNLEKILGKAREKKLVSPDDELTDAQIQNLIFKPGFTTATNVDDVSGRGVGMDVVSRNITDLGGKVEVDSIVGKGCTFTIQLPLTLAILDGQLVRVGNEIFIISLLTIVESIQMDPKYLNTVAGKSEVYRFRDEYIPIIRLYDVFGIESACQDLEKGLLVVIDTGQRVGLFVDEVLGQQQVVIKSLDTNFCHIQGFAGATILGDGTVAMILDTQGLIERCGQNQHEETLSIADEES